MQLIVSTIVFVVKANNGGETRKYYYCTSYICGALPQPSEQTRNYQHWLPTSPPRKQMLCLQNQAVPCVKCR